MTDPRDSTDPNGSGGIGDGGDDRPRDPPLRRPDGGEPTDRSAGRPDGGTNVLEDAREAELDRGPLQQWVSDSISHPERVYRAMFYVAAIFFLFTTLFPFYWLLMVALTPEGQLQDIIFTPNGFNPGAFIEVFEVVPFHVYMFNSFVIALASTVVVLVIASLAGYAFGRLEFPGRTPLMLLVLVISFSRQRPSSSR